MASGSFEAKTSNRYIYGTVNWTSTLDSINNQSTVTASMTLRKYYHFPDCTLPSPGTGTWAIYINNVPKTITEYKNFAFGVDVIVISSTVIVPHNPDGSKTCSIVVTGGMPPGNSYTSTDAEGTATLDTNIVKATILTAPDFTDLDNPNITFSNPKGYPVQFKIENLITFTDLIATETFTNYSADNYTFELTEDQREILRTASANYSNFPVRFTVVSTIGGLQYYSFLDRKMTTVGGEPIFTNFGFEDSNPYTVGITGDSSKFIQGKSKFRAYVRNVDKMIPQKHSAGKGYSVSIGEKSNYQPYTESLDVVFSEISTSLLVESVRVTALDSRDKYTLVDKPVTIYPYDVNKNTSKIYAYRQNGFSGVMVVNIEGTYNTIFVDGVNKNTISVVFKYKVLGSADPWTINEYNLFSDANGEFKDSRTFNVVAELNYEMQISVSDKFDSIGDIYEDKSYSFPIFYVDEDYRIGVNMVPDGTDYGLYLKDTDVFYERFKTYFDTYLYQDIYNRISSDLVPAGFVLVTDYEVSDVADMPVAGSWILNYHVIYDDITPVAWLHKRVS